MSSAYQVPRFSVDAIELKVQIEINLSYLESIKNQTAADIDAWNASQLEIVIASHHLQISQLDEDIRLNKIL